MQSKFFNVREQRYTNGQFCEITKRLLSTHKLEGEIANLISNAVWNKSLGVKDFVKIGHHGQIDGRRQVRSRNSSSGPN